MESKKNGIVDKIKARRAELAKARLNVKASKHRFPLRSTNTRPNVERKNKPKNVCKKQIGKKCCKKIKAGGVNKRKPTCLIRKKTKPKAKATNKLKKNLQRPRKS